jgi:hypothetical protein
MGLELGDTWNASKILVGKPLEKQLLGRLRRTWADNIKMDTVLEK